MNNIDFKEGGFPFNTDTLTFMQKAYSDCISALSTLGGDNYILKGCTVTGGAVSDGFVVINGEVLPFKRGTLQATVMIRENKESVLYADDIERDSFFNRWVEFGTGAEQISWASLTRIDNLQKMASKLSELTGVLNDHAISSTAHPRDSRNQVAGSYASASHTHPRDARNQVAGSYASATHTHSNTNSWRGIDDVPVNGQKNESISSNWAYNHKSSSQAHPRDTRNATVNHTHSRDTRNQVAGSYITTTDSIEMGNRFVQKTYVSSSFSTTENSATQLPSDCNVFFDTSGSGTRYVKLPANVKEGFVIWIGSKWGNNLVVTSPIRNGGAAATKSSTTICVNENDWSSFVYINGVWSRMHTWG